MGERDPDQRGEERALHGTTGVFGVIVTVPAFAARFGSGRPSWTSMRMVPPCSRAAPTASSCAGRLDPASFSADAHEAHSATTTKNQVTGLIARIYS